MHNTLRAEALRSFRFNPKRENGAYQQQIVTLPDTISDGD
jgi:hypothetical protein